MIKFSREHGQEVMAEKKILGSDFKFPDLPPLEKGKYYHEEVVEYPVQVGDLKFNGKFTFERAEDVPEGKHGHVARADFEAYDPDTKERVLSFKATLTQGVYDAEYREGISGTPRHWHIWNRRVEPGYREKDVGTFSMCALEEAIQRFGQEQPDLVGEWIQLDTLLGSLTNLVVDPNWLKEWLAENPDLPWVNYELLNKRANKTDRNLGYQPHPVDQERGIRVLQSGTAELKDLDALPPGKDVRFMKKF